MEGPATAGTGLYSYVELFRVGEVRVSSAKLPRSSNIELMRRKHL
jgi:hypothetical protein